MDDKVLFLLFALLGAGLLSVSIGQLWLIHDVRKLWHGLKTHGHGIIYVDEHGNKIRKTDAQGNQVEFYD